MTDNIKEILKTKKKVYLTCAGRVDGSGAQAHAIISTMVAAEYLGIEYVHTPFNTIAHNDKDEKKDVWIKGWEKFFNLGLGSQNIDDLKSDNSSNFHKKVVNFSELIRFGRKRLEGILNSHCLYSVTKSHEIIEKFFDTEELQDAYHKVLKRIQFNYDQTRKEKTFHYNEDRLNVAIHIRKGDIVNDPTKFKTNDYYFRVMEQIQDVLEDLHLNYDFHIFSEGRLKIDFPELTWFNRHRKQTKFKEHEKGKWKITKNIYVHLNGDPQEDLHHLIKADILVMSKSCYSHVAGLYNPDNVKLYTSWRYKPFKSWINLEETGDFDINQFKMKIKAYNEIFK